MKVVEAVSQRGPQQLPSQLMSHPCGWDGSKEQAERVEGGQDAHCAQRIAVPAEVIWRVDSSGDRAFLHFHGKTISAPWTDLQALRFVAKATIFCPADIPGDLTPDHKCQLAQHLLDEGFIRRH